MNEFDRMNIQRNQAREKKKKILLTGIVICIVIIIVLAIMIIYYQKVDASTFKLYIDDAQSQVSEGFYLKNDKGDTYVRARDIASYINWSYQNGEYGSFNEDVNSGYIQNEYEIASFVAGSNVLKKYIQVTATETTDESGEEVAPYETNSANGTLETTILDLPIISQNGQIYFPLQHLSDICNCRVIYENEYRMYIYEQNYLINLAQIKAGEYGLKSVSGIYENMRTLGYGMMVVSNGSLYKVVNIDTGEDIIGLKYDDMVFAQNTKEFFVKTSSGGEETVGIIDISGNSVVQPKNYDNIQILSDDLGLYLVDKNGDYGVLDKNGDIVVHCEYDSIGIPEDLLTNYEFSVEDNKYVLFDNTLIVEDNGVYGIYNIDGTLTAPVSFDGFGYIVDDDENPPRNAEKALTIEYDELEISDGSVRSIKAIILQDETEEGIKYGLYDCVSGKQILPCVTDRIYSVTSRGNTEYYMVYGGQTTKLSEYFINTPDAFAE